MLCRASTGPFSLVAAPPDSSSVTTGFGGSADTRTDELLNLQYVPSPPYTVLTARLALLEHQLCGVTPTQLDGSGSASIMPAHIVRGAILIRVQSLVRGM